MSVGLRLSSATAVGCLTAAAALFPPAAATAAAFQRRFAYLKSRVRFGALANVSDEQFRSSYLEPTFGLRADGSLNAQAIALSPLLP